jgi:hypothetical protein
MHDSIATAAMTSLRSMIGLPLRQSDQGIALMNS